MSFQLANSTTAQIGATSGPSATTTNTPIALRLYDKLLGAATIPLKLFFETLFKLLIDRQTLRANGKKAGSNEVLTYLTATKTFRRRLHVIRSSVPRPIKA